MGANKPPIHHPFELRVEGVMSEEDVKDAADNLLPEW